MSLQRAGMRYARVSRPLAVIAAALASVAIAPTSQSGAGAKRPTAASHRSFDELYAEGQRANASMKTLTARFTETTTSSLLTRPLVSRGRLAVERPTRVVLRYTDPEPRVVLIDGNKMTLSWPSRNIRQVTDIGTAQGRVQKYFVNGTAEDLRKQFDVEQHDLSDRPNTYYVSMVPKRKQIREALIRLDLWVNQSSKLMDSMKMTFANGDTKTMVFEDVVPNAALEPGVFTLSR
jgi:outer membrane lipoprotein-sorting protein